MRPGDQGEAVIDVQRRLAAVGFDIGRDELGKFGEDTARAIRAFQEARRLRSDGVCGRQTWSALVEAGYRLGDRLLYHRSPPLRGDDVSEIQQRLGTLGFDAGRVDGIFGERTARALLDFQRNAGLTTDGICGPATLSALGRLGARAPIADNAAGIREREALRGSPPTLSGRHLVVGEFGGLGALAAAISRVLSRAGAQVLALSDPEGSVQAAQANTFAADAYLGLSVRPEGCTVCFYASGNFHSVGGSQLAKLIEHEVSGALLKSWPSESRGMALPVLRETRMPAVLCELGPASALVEHTAELAAAFARAMAAWVEAPTEV